MRVMKVYAFMAASSRLSRNTSAIDMSSQLFRAYSVARQRTLVFYLIALRYGFFCVNK